MFVWFTVSLWQRSRIMRRCWANGPAKGLSQVVFEKGIKSGPAVCGEGIIRDRTPACAEARPRGGAVGVVCSLTGVKPEGLIRDADMAPRATLSSDVHSSEAAVVTRSRCCLLTFWGRSRMSHGEASVLPDGEGCWDWTNNTGWLAGLSPWSFPKFDATSHYLKNRPDGINSGVK